MQYALPMDISVQEQGATNIPANELYNLEWGILSKGILKKKYCNYEFQKQNSEVWGLTKTRTTWLDLAPILNVTHEMHSMDSYEFSSNILMGIGFSAESRDMLQSPTK